MELNMPAEVDLKSVVALLIFEVLELKLRLQLPQASDEEIAELLKDRGKQFFQRCADFSSRSTE